MQRPLLKRICDVEIQQSPEKCGEFEKFGHQVGSALSLGADPAMWTGGIHARLSSGARGGDTVWPKERVRHAFHGARSWNLMQRVKNDCAPYRVFPLLWH